MAKLEIRPEETICCNDKLLQKTTACLPFSASWQPFFTSPDPDKALYVPCHLKSVCYCYFYPRPTPPIPASMRHFSKDAVNVRFHLAAISWLIRWGLRNHSHVCFFYSLLRIWYVSRWHYWSLLQRSDANSCWWPFPFSFVVTWLCQSVSN